MSLIDPAFQESSSTTESWDVWAKENVPGDVSRGPSTPTLTLTPEQHAATKAVYRDWLFENTGKRVGGRVDWQKVSWPEVKSLAERMFDAAKVPPAALHRYYEVFRQYVAAAKK